MRKPVVTITHHDVKEPEYDIESLKTTIIRCDQHIALLQEEIDKQKAYKQELSRLIQQQEERNRKKT